MTLKPTPYSSSSGEQLVSDATASDRLRGGDNRVHRLNEIN
jgi:hypothetical protein